MADLIQTRTMGNASRTDKYAKILSREGDVEFSLAQAKAELEGPVSKTQREELRQKVERLNVEGASLREQIERELPELVDMVVPPIVDLVTLRNSLNDDEVLLEYHVSSDGAFCWAVRRWHMAIVKLGRSAEELATLVEAAFGAYRHTESTVRLVPGTAVLHMPPTIRRTLTDRRTVAASERKQARAQLSRALLDSLPTNVWAGVKRVIVVADGALHRVPFDTLPLPSAVGSGQLADQFTVAYSPSSTVLLQLRERKESMAKGLFIGFGDPAFDLEADPLIRSNYGIPLERLPGTRDEVERISSLFGAQARCVLGKEATEEAVRRYAHGYRYVHFATHGIFNDTDPLASALAFAPSSDGNQTADEQDGTWLRAYDMFSLQLDADLVVCSACDTAAGSIVPGEGLVGFSRTLFFAGARCLVLSLWPVPDNPTSDLMFALYKAIKSGANPGEALRSAKTELRANSAYDDPFFWAGFIPLGVAW